MSGLREWQELCIERALEIFQSGTKHFFCLACPGAGKTRMAAELAARLMSKHEIDLVISFAPSLTVANGIRATFEVTTGKRMDGLMGAIGHSLTYHSMNHLSEDIWNIFKSHKVLAVFDEIHHCAGSEIAHSNSWGKAIIEKIRNQAKYTVALSGTPWRSDELPVTLAEYSASSAQIAVDFTYGLAQAVQDKVCRNPNIMLVDNSLITCGNESELKHYSSISTLLDDGALSYQAVLNEPTFLSYILRRANKKLLEIKVSNPEAAGLVVASSVSHARYIQDWMTKNLECHVVVVNHTNPDAQGRIDAFREGQGTWIVSVGMISEGTDIPRLQVCCHLSRVRTEMHFRQVLGRIMRRSGSPNQEAWMFTADTTEMRKFSQRLIEDIPLASVTFERRTFDNIQLNESNRTTNINNRELPVLTLEVDYYMQDFEKLATSTALNVQKDYSVSLSEKFSAELITLLSSNLYRQA